MMTKRALFQLALVLAAPMVGGCTGNAGVGPVAPYTASNLSQVAGTSPVVYVAGLANAVVFYPASLRAKNPSPIGSITQGVTRAQGLWVDKNDTLYISNSSDPASIVEYKRGASAPFKTITNGLYLPGSLAVDSSLTLYVADAQNGGVILVYPHGASSPSRTISIPFQGRRPGLGSMGFDPKGNLLIATSSVESNTAAVYSIAPGSSNAVNLNLTGVPGDALGTDAAGNIYVGGVEGDIAVYAPGSTAPKRSINAGNTGFYSTLAVTANGTVYWPNYDSGQMYEFKPGASGPTNVFVGGGGVDAAVGTR